MVMQIFMFLNHHFEYADNFTAGFDILTIY